jgi:hypothetical protein
MGLSFDECSKIGAATSRSYSVSDHWIWRGGLQRPMRSSILWFSHLFKDLRRLEPNLVVGVYVRKADGALRVRHEHRRLTVVVSCSSASWRMTSVSRIPKRSCGSYGKYDRWVEIRAETRKFGPPPVPGLPGVIEPLESARALVLENRAQSNCAASYADRVRDRTNGGSGVIDVATQTWFRGDSNQTEEMSTLRLTCPPTDQDDQSGVRSTGR